MELSERLATAPASNSSLSDSLSKLSASVAATVPQPDQWSFKLVPPGRNKVAVIVIGAGGVGARIVPALSQMLRSGDALKIVDHDIVEQRNLHRQNFTHRDIGQHKATVLARRYAKDGIHTQAFCTQLKAGNELSGIFGSTGGLGTTPAVMWTSAIIIGAVDNPSARQAILKGYQNLHGHVPTAYIDVGNEMRGGQVLLSFFWPGKATNLANGSALGPVTLVLDATSVIPDLWIPVATPATPVADETPACADRLDLQTVVVNNMGACLVLNIVNQLLGGLPIQSAGTFFSTLNTISQVDIVKDRKTPDHAGWHGKSANG